MTLIRACPKCKSEHFIKNGKLHARQRYECKACGYNFTVSKLGKSKPSEVRTIAKLEKVGSNAIGKTANKNQQKFLSLHYQQ